MRIGSELAPFISSPVMLIIGTRNAANRPAIGRGMGARVVDSNEVEVLFSSWQWPETFANLRENNRMAVTFARPSDYVCYQIKGRAELRDAQAADLERSRRYAADILAVLEGLGLTRDIMLSWLCDREPVVARMAVEEIYIQTPGPKAGTSVETET